MFIIGPKGSGKTNAVQKAVDNLDYWTRESMNVEVWRVGELPDFVSFASNDMITKTLIMRRQKDSLFYALNEEWVGECMVYSFI